ncbi:MAG: HisA/HisF-related TIM barrel protein [Candidatus Kapaibacterium sp.]
MLIIPSLELENGVCKRCIIGEPGTEELYLELQNKPEELIKLLRKENFKALHLIDYDSLLHGKNIDYKNIAELCDCIDTPIELHARFTDKESCRMALESGLYRLIISNELLLNQNLCKDLIKEFSASRLCFCLIVQDSQTFYDPKFNDEFTPEILLEKLVETGARRILIGTNESIFKGESIDITMFKSLIENRSFRYTIYGGINSPEELWELNQYKFSNIDSVIIGQAIFSNAFPCQKIWRLIEAELENQ